MSYWILKDRKPIQEKDFEKWCRWKDASDTVLNDDLILGVQVKTLFIGMVADEDPDPHLFATIVLGYDGEVPVYKTWEDAKNGHKKMVRKIADKIAMKN